VLGDFFSSVMDGAQLLRLSEDGTNPFMNLCHTGL
jgi:hypothetical protein